MPGSHHTCPLQGQDTANPDGSLAYQPTKPCMLDALLHSERGKEKGKAMSLDRKMVVNPPSGERNDGLGDERPRFSEAGQISQLKGNPQTQKKTPLLPLGVTSGLGCTTVHGLLPALVSGKQLV